MNVIVAGAGEVGGHTAEVLSTAGHKVTVIDLAADRLHRLADALDLRTVVGHCAHFGVLHAAGADRCDLMVAATQIDEINMLAASMAKAAGARKTIVRVHHAANFSLRHTSYAAQLGIDELICPEYLASVDIVRTLRNPGSVALEEFAHGELMMQRLCVGDTAPAVGKKLSEIALPDHTRLATVEHGGTPVIAEAHTTINAGDFVTLLGEAESFDAARKLFVRGKEKRIHIAVLGETATAVWLCRALKNRLFSVRLFVQHRDRAEELSEKLGHVTVLEADPTDPSTAAEEHMDRVEAFVAVTEDDERNILACAQAKTLGVPTAIAVLQRSKYQHLLHHLGVDHAVSPGAVAVRAIRQLIDTSPVRSLAAFADGMAEVYEIWPSKRAAAVGKDLRNIALPPRVMIAATRRDGHIYLPGADDQIIAGDIVLVIGPPDIADDLSKLFVSK